MNLGGDGSSPSGRNYAQDSVLETCEKDRRIHLRGHHYVSDEWLHPSPRASRHAMGISSCHKYDRGKSDGGKGMEPVGVHPICRRHRTATNGLYDEEAKTVTASEIVCAAHGGQALAHSAAGRREASLRITVRDVPPPGWSRHSHGGGGRVGQKPALVFGCSLEKGSFNHGLPGGHGWNLNRSERRQWRPKILPRRPSAEFPQPIGGSHCHKRPQRRAKKTGNFNREIREIRGKGNEGKNAGWGAGTFERCSGAALSSSFFHVFCVV